MAPNVTKKYKEAAVNAEPGWLDLELSVEKTIHWINEAGKNGCKLVAFPELCKSNRAVHLSNPTGFRLSSMTFSYTCSTRLFIAVTD